MIKSIDSGRLPEVNPEVLPSCVNLGKLFNVSL